MIVATKNCGCPKQTSSVSSESPCSPCCFNSPGSIRFSRGLKRAATDERHSRSISRPKFKKRKTSDAKQDSTDKIVSEIVKSGQPYKEIEAVINNNRVVVRMQKEPVREEYEPPCECVGQDTAASGSTTSLKKCEDGVAFEMAEGTLELCGAPRKGASSICERSCRTITLYPQMNADESSSKIEKDERSIKTKKGVRVKRTIDFEENPNIFLLRIKKRCETGDKKHKVDLEFRAARPWQSRVEKEKKLPSDLPEKLEEHKEKANKKEPIVEKSTLQ